MAQMSLPEDEDVIKALPSDRADQPFDMAVLPRRSRRCRSVANAPGANAPSERLAIDPIAITDNILRRVLPAQSGGTQRHAFRDEYLMQFDVKGPVRIPKSSAQ